MERVLHRPLKTIAFSVDGIGRQACKVRKQLQDLKIDSKGF
jgi:hypothetical protein